MKVNQITEAPVSAIKQKAQAIGSRVLNKVGAKATAHNLAGKADFGATANKLYQQFNAYLGTQNKTIKQATGVDLDTFLKSKNVTRNDIPDGVLQKAQLDKIMQDAAKQALLRQQGAKTNSQQGAASAKQQGAAQGNTASGEIPADMKEKLDKLTPKQRQQLMSAL